MNEVIPENAAALTVVQAAELAQVHEITIRDWIKAGRIKSVKVGRSIRIPRTAFLRTLGVED